MRYLACLMIAACALEAPETSTTSSALRCEMFVCGDNAASAGDGILFDELNLAGEPNYAGTKLLGASLGGHPMTIDIDRDRLRAIDQWTGIPTTDGGLVGMIMKLQSSSGESFEVLIDSFDEGSVRFLAGANDTIPVYLMKYRRQALGQKKFDHFVCVNDVIDAAWPSVGHHALVFRGDRYDPVTKRAILNDPNSPWSFLACSGSGAGKMHLHRHTVAGAFDAPGTGTPYMTTLDQRTTLLKMITADYCGTGEHQFTVTGTPLAFTTAAPFSMPAMRPVASDEAIWGPDGAVCLTFPRRDPILVPPGSLVWLRADIENACGHTLPTCDSMMWLWPWFGYGITANPA